MKHLWAVAFAVAVVAVCAVSSFSQPPEGKEKGPPGKKGGPPPFELGKVLPPFVRDDLDLTADQEKEIAALEKEVKERLEKILTADQKKKVSSLRPPRKDGPPPDGKEKGPPGGKDGPPRKGDDLPKKKDDGPQVRAGGVQWFATWEAGRAEAERTGRPILFVSAAPHCAGVSGIW